jgi:hypothetical protein
MDDAFGRMAAHAAFLGLRLGREEIASIAAERGFGEAELTAVEAVLAAAAEEKRSASVETLIRLSRLPKREPRTFEGFDFSRIQGRDAKALRALPELSDLVAGRNIAFIGPEGIGNYAGLPIMLRNGAEPQADGLEPPCSPA